MEQYRKVIKNRIKVGFLEAVVTLGLFILGIVIIVIQSEDGGMYEGFLSGVQVGLAASMFGFSIFGIIKHTRALHDEKKLRNMYICENDERQKFIMQKSGGTILLACAYIIIVVAIPLGYFSEVVFFSLFGCGFFLLLAKLVLQVYYSSKY